MRGITRALCVAMGIWVFGIVVIGMPASPSGPGAAEDVFAAGPDTQIAIRAPAAAGCGSDSVGSSFNGTAIAGGTYIWFNAVLNPGGIPTTGATITFTGGTVTFSANGTNYSLPVPDARVIYSPATSAATATTTYGGA